MVEKAEKKKKVVVVGGGPAGMEAARVAALRGHNVTLFERTRRLGGLLPVAAMVKGPHPEDLPEIVRYYGRQLEELGVEVRLGKEADPAAILEMKPDVAIVATGGAPAVPQITGIDRPNVISGADLHRKLKFFLRFFEPGTLRSLSRLLHAHRQEGRHPGWRDPGMRAGRVSHEEGQKSDHRRNG